MSFAQLQQHFAPLHAALTNESYSPALAACDDLLAQLQSLRSQLQTASSSPPTSASSTIASLATQSKQLLASLTAIKQSHTRNFKQLHTRTQTFQAQLDAIKQLDTQRLHYHHFNEQHVDQLVVDGMAREGWMEAAREMRAEVAEVRGQRPEERLEDGEGVEERRREREDRLEAAMTRMHDIKRSLQQQREVGPCLAWVKEEESRAMQRVAALRVDKQKEEEEKTDKKRAGGRVGAEGALAGDGSRMVDDEDGEERVGLALDMFASSISSPPPSEALLSGSSTAASSPPSQPPPTMAVLLAEAESVYKQLHALHFDLHQIRFLQLLTSPPPPTQPSASSATAAMSDSTSSPLSSLSSGSGQQALLYAQTHFTPFANDRIDDIRKLSGLLLFYPNLTASPYANILTPPTSPTAANSQQHGLPATPSALSSLLSSVSSTFTSLYLRLHNLPAHSPLLTLLQASSLVYPQLVHYQSLPLSSSSASLELDLGSSFPFHSTFICPVTREPSHVGNEPVMLPCGHLISVSAMDKIVRGQRSMSRKFKCFSEDTRLLTSAGFLFVDEIERRLDEVTFACYSERTRGLEYHAASRLIIKPAANHRMIEFGRRVFSSGHGRAGAQNGENAGSHHISLLVTDDHDMYVRRGRVVRDENDSTCNVYDDAELFAKHTAATLLSSTDQANNRASHHAVRFLAFAEAGHSVGIERRPFVALPFVNALALKTTQQWAAFIALYGFWLGNGSIDHSFSKRITFRQKNSDFQRLKQLLREAELIERRDWFSCYSSATQSETVSITNERWVMAFNVESSGTIYHTDTDSDDMSSDDESTSISSTCGARSIARLNEECVRLAGGFASWVVQLSRDEMRLLLDGYRKGDGSWHHNRDVIHTSSTTMRDHLVRALLHAGYTAHFSIADSADDCWAVSYIDPTSAIAQAEDMDISMESEARRVDDYQGRVWCVTVPTGLVVAQRAERDSSGVVTRVSRPVIIGQCPTCPREQTAQEVIHIQL